jgi:hypothetical protein
MLDFPTHRHDLKGVLYGLSHPPSCLQPIDMSHTHETAGDVQQHSLANQPNNHCAAILSVTVLREHLISDINQTWRTDRLAVTGFSKRFWRQSNPQPLCRSQRAKSLFRSLNDAQLLKKFPASYRTWRFTIMFTTARRQSLSRVNPHPQILFS